MTPTPIRRVATAAVSVAIVAAALVAATGWADAAERRSGFADVRRATAKYHDVNVALADGFVPGGDCSENPGVGGMGIHYLNPARLSDPAVDATRPEVLLYEPLADGRLRLVGVEWFSADPDQDVTTDAGRPSILDVPFDGPMLGHEPGMPVHFDLHAWIWKHNPAGTFSPWNRRVTCEKPVDPR